jgi:hypothetical protein
VLVTLATASAALVVTVALAQPAEVKPLDVESTTQTIYRQDSGLSDSKARENAKQREKARKTFLAEEAQAILRSGQRVVRDDDDLYVYVDFPNSQHAVVMRTIWGWDPGIIYVYHAFDDIGRFHVVRVSLVENEGYFLLISAKAGLVYRINGPPIYAPDKTKFFAAGCTGMGCADQVVVYRSMGESLSIEAALTTDFGWPCSHEWSGSNEVKSICRNSAGTGEVEYRLAYRDGAWQETRSEVSR